MILMKDDAPGAKADLVSFLENELLKVLKIIDAKCEA